MCICLYGSCFSGLLASCCVSLKQEVIFWYLRQSREERRDVLWRSNCGLKAASAIFKDLCDIETPAFLFSSLIVAYRRSLLLFTILRVKLLELLFFVANLE